MMDADSETDANMAQCPHASNDASGQDAYNDCRESKSAENKRAEEEAAESENEFVEEEDPGEDHEFEIIDQVESEEEVSREDATPTEQVADSQGKPQDPGGGEANADSYSDSSEEEEDDVDDSEIHAMLEKGINRNSIKKREEPTEGKPIIKYKTVLKEFDTDPFDILPEGWIFVTHNCGMPIYLHKDSRVCTMARPYALGTASARTHSIPISAIPCLMYKRQLDKISEEQKESFHSVEQPVIAQGTDTSVPGNKFVCQATQDTLSNRAHEGSSTACPIRSATPGSAIVPVKTEQRSVLVAEETSCQGRIQQATQQKEELHTGINEFSMVNQNSHELENIAVEKCGSGISGLVSDGNEDKLSINVDGVNARTLDRSNFHPNSDSRSLSSYPDNSTPKNLPSDAFPVLERKSHACIEESQQSNVLTLQEPEKYIPEEGEIVDDESSSEKEMRLSDSKGKSKPQQETCIATATTPTSAQAVQAQHCNNEQQKATHKIVTDTQPVQNGVKESSDAHVVREEEGNGSQEQSELVTSNSNSLATLKRKIESLRNKHGGKLRRLDAGRGASSSAVGWPVENNVAASSHQFDPRNPAAIADSQETLKANAAAIKIKCADERARESLLDSKAVQSYCSKLFQFKVIEVKKYSSWRERRKHLDRKNRRNRPELPKATKLITCPMPGYKADPSGAGPVKREFVLNPTGKSYLCILHEYMQRTLKVKPIYVFKELENSKTPYGATVTINNIEYGAGYASSKKVAKQEAAKETLKILMPDLFNKMSDKEIKDSISDLSFFDNVKVTDSRILELGNKVGQPSPFEILQECLRRNFGLGDTQCDITTKPLKNQKCEFTIAVGKHTATVIARNKRDGKQSAAQAILAKLHPHVPSWGSLLRLYGTSVEKPIQKLERMSEFKSHAPNHSVLDSLREEMRKLHKQKEAIQVKGKIIISSKDLPSKMFGVDL